jgi:hypothetical protein
MANNEFGGGSFFGSAFSTTGAVIGSGGGGMGGGGGRGPGGGGAATTGPGLSMTPDWHRWVAENVLLRNSPQSIVEAMLKAGFDQPTAVREVQAAVNHPYLRAAAQLGAGANGQAPVAVQASTAKADKIAWFLENQRRAKRLASTFGQVPRVKKPSRQAFLDDFYSQNRPCIIEGAMDDWPAMTKWTGEYLKAKCGDRIVEVQANRSSDANYEINQTKLKKEMTFGEFVDIVESGIQTNDWYITANNSGKNKEALKELWGDIVLFDYLKDDPSNNGFFWYGPAGTVTPLHHDLTNNFMAQVRGSKRIKLVAPYESADVYNNRHCYSPVDPENPDLARFPKFADVRVIDVVIGPGDLFFLPVGWWHHVRGLEISITMTFTNFVYDNDFFSFYTTYNDI